MKTTTILGIALIVLGLVAFAYQGITYTTRQNVIDPGPLQSIFLSKISDLSYLEQTAICLFAILTLTLAVCLPAGGGDIVTCRVARLSQDHPGMDLVFCCECGSANLEVWYTSKTLGPHVCPTCAGSMLEGRMVKENHVKSPVREQPVA